MSNLQTAQEAAALSRTARALHSVMQEITTQANNGEQVLMTVITDETAIERLRSLGYKVERREDTLKDVCEIQWTE